MTGLNAGEKTGIQAAVAALHDPNAVPVTPAEQLSMLPGEEEAKENGADKNALSRGAGRPPGAKNKSTEEWREFILSQHRSPLVVLAEVASGSLHDLAVKLGHDPKNTLTFERAMDLLKVQLQCAKELAPYLHQKQPMAIEGTGEGLMTLVIGGMPDQKKHQELDPLAGMTLLDITPTENQQVTPENAAKSNETKANETAQAEDDSRASNVSTDDLETTQRGDQ